MPKIKAAYGQHMAAAIEQGTLDASSCQLGEELELELPPLEELPKNIAQLIGGTERRLDVLRLHVRRSSFQACLADNMANIRLNTIDGNQLMHARTCKEPTATATLP